MVCKLNKALYGLKQAPWAWYAKLRTALLSFGFSVAKTDSSLFIKHTNGQLLLLLVYVDDILIIGDSLSEILSLVSQLNDQYFSLKDLSDVSYFLGIHVTPTLDGMVPSQKKYIIDLLSKTNMLNANPVSSPMVGGEKLFPYGSNPFSDPQLYCQVVGALQYATITRLEMSYTVNRVCQFMHQPLEDHWKVVKRILRYLKGTLDYGLHLYKAS